QGDAGVAADVAGAAGDEYGGHWIIFVHGNIKKAKVKSVCPRNTRKRAEKGQSQKRKSKNIFSLRRKVKGKRAKAKTYLACGARSRAKGRKQKHNIFF
ncbi:MAG: hypothetical protein R6U68_17280, partial [Desulfobacteraceae bacterium]